MRSGVRGLGLGRSSALIGCATPSSVTTSPMMPCLLVKWSFALPIVATATMNATMPTTSPPRCVHTWDWNQSGLSPCPQHKTGEKHGQTAAVKPGHKSHPRR